MKRRFELILVVILSSFVFIKGGYYLFIGQSAAGTGKYSPLYSILPDKYSGFLDIFLGILIVVLYVISINKRKKNN